MSTVRATRAASEEALVESALPRLKALLSFGVTCVEIKSGYGLNVPDELKMLRAAQTLGQVQPVHVEATLLCAHAIPEEHREDRARYVDLCLNEILPEVARLKLARFCDAFAEEGAFSISESRRILSTAQGLGMIGRLHADQLTASGGALLAAELGCATADHLEHVTPQGAAALAAADVVGVLVPMSTLFVRARPFADGRALRRAGVTLALGTNVNPGSAMSENLPLTLGLACLENGLSAAEAYHAMTAGGAKALRLEGHGRLVVGGPANFVVFRCGSYRHLPYHLGINHVREVWCQGVPAWVSPESQLCG
jgi:imidazolonepropionase